MWASKQVACKGCKRQDSKNNLELEWNGRKITPYIRSCLALKMESIIAEKAKANQVKAGGDKKSEDSKSHVPTLAEVIDSIGTSIKTRIEICGCDMLFVHPRADIALPQRAVVGIGLYLMHVFSYIPRLGTRRRGIQGGSERPCPKGPRYTPMLS